MFREANMRSDSLESNKSVDDDNKFIHLKSMLLNESELIEYSNVQKFSLNVNQPQQQSLNPNNFQ